MKTSQKKTQSRRLKFVRRLKALVLAAAGASLAGTAAPAQTVVNTDTGIRAETAYFLAVGQRGPNGPESYVVPVSGAARIAEVRQYLAERSEGRETRPLIPTVVLRLGSDGENRNHSAAGAPLWPWHVAEVQKFERYTRPQVEPAVYIFTRDASLSEIAGYLKGDPVSLPSNVFTLRDYPIAMELRSEFPTARAANLANISDRGFAGTAGDAKITGFVIDGDRPRNVVIRALGPTLARFGVGNALANPRLEIFRGTEKIAENDDWMQGNLNRPFVAPAIAGVPPPSPFHLLPGDSREPALELSLAPGAYTIVVTGVDGATGIVLTEVHTL